VTAVVDGCHQCGGDDRADTRQLGEPAAGRVRAADGDDPGIELLDPAIDVAELIQQVGEDLMCEVGQLGLGDRRRRLSCKSPRTLGQYDAVFREQPARVVNQRGAQANQPLARTVQRLQVLLLGALDRRAIRRSSAWITMSVCEARRDKDEVGDRCLRQVVPT
jgi:hypothetical protein